MPKDIIALQKKRESLANECRSILDVADKEKRSLSDEENGRYDSLFKQQQELKSDIDTEKRQRELEREVASDVASVLENNEVRAESGDSKIKIEERMMNAATTYLKSGTVTDEEFRALTAGTDTEGGYLMPETLVNKLIKNVDDQTFIRNYATVMPANGSLGAINIENDMSDAEWTTELATGSEDNDLSFGHRELKPLPLAKRVKISKKLVRNVSNITDVVLQRLGYKFAIAQERGFLIGTGSGQPLGMFTASANGISTDRDIVGDNTTSQIASDTLLAMKFGLKQAYHKNAKWIMHPDIMLMISKLKDADGNYMWLPSLRDGEPDKILNIEALTSEFAPSAAGAGNYAAILGDISNYWIAEEQKVEIQRLDELYAETNQVGYIGRAEIDGQPVLEEAFVRMQFGS